LTARALEILDDIVVSYLPNAFAFIYVINSSLAGGVQKDRVSVCNSLYLKEMQKCQLWIGKSDFLKLQIPDNICRYDVSEHKNGKSLNSGVSEVCLV